MPKITDHQKGMIEAYHSEGKSNREIARLLNIDEGSVRYNLRKKGDSWLNGQSPEIWTAE